MRCRRFAAAGLLLLIGAATVRAGESPDELYRFAKRLMLDRRDYAAAAEKFAAYVRAHPDREDAPQALAYAALCRSRNDQPGEAAAAHRRLLREYPKAAERLRREAMAYGGDAAFQAGDYAAAADLYAKLRKTFPGSLLARNARFWEAEAAYRLGEAARDAGKDDDAKTWFARARAGFLDVADRKPPDDDAADALYNAAYAAFELGDHEAAADLHARFAEAHPADARASECRYLRAEALFAAERYADAFAAYGHDALRAEASPRRTDALAGQAWCRVEQKRPADAARLFAAAAAAASDAARAGELRFRSGEAHLRADAPLAAARAFAAVAKRAGHPLRAPALLRKAEAVLLLLEKVEAGTVEAPADPVFAGGAGNARTQARTDLREALEGALGPAERADALVLLAETLLHEDGTERDREAAAAAARALGRLVENHPRDPRLAWALYNRAWALHTSGDSAAACGAVARLVEIAPADPLRLEAAFALADYAEAAGKTKTAAATLAWVADDAPAWAKTAAADLPKRKAKALADRAKTLRADALVRLANRHADAGRTGRAVERWTTLATDHPDHPAAPDAWLQAGAHAEADDRLADAADAYANAIRLAAKRTSDAARAAHARARIRLGAVEVVRGQAEEGDARAKRLAGALRHLDHAATERAPGDLAPLRHYYAAEALYGLDRAAGALPRYEAALAAGPPDDLADAVLFGLAWCRRDLGRDAAAREAFAKLTTDHPQSRLVPESLHALGRLHLAADDSQAAAAAFGRLLEAHSDHPLAADARVDLGAALRRLERYDDAADALRVFLEKHPDHPEAGRAKFLLALTLWDAAAPLRAAARRAGTALREAEADAPAAAPEDGDAEAAETLAKLRKEAAAARAAAAAGEPPLEAALRGALAATDAPARTAHLALRLGELAYGRDARAEALPHYEAALAAARKAGASGVIDRILYRLGWTHLRLAEAEDAPDDAAATHRGAARKAFATLATEHAESPLAGEAAFRAGELLREADAPEDALAQYDRALTLLPQDDATRRAACVYGKALVLLALDRPGDAAAACTAWLDADPPEAYRRALHWAAGHAAWRAGADADAREHFLAARADDFAGEPAAKAQYGLGLLAARAEAWAAARDAFLKVDLFYPQWREWAARALLRAAEAAERLDRAADARQDRRRIVEVYPKTAAAAEAARLLEDADAAPSAAPQTPAPGETP